MHSFARATVAFFSRGSGKDSNVLLADVPTSAWDDVSYTIVGPRTSSNILSRRSRFLRAARADRTLEGTFHNGAAYRAEIDTHVPLFVTYIVSARATRVQSAAKRIVSLSGYQLVYSSGDLLEWYRSIQEPRLNVFRRNPSIRINSFPPRINSGSRSRVTGFIRINNDEI